MTAKESNVLWKAIDPLEAQEQLRALQVSSFPNMKPPAKRKLIKELEAMAYPRTIYKREAKEQSEIFNILGGKIGRR